MKNKKKGYKNKLRLINVNSPSWKLNFDRWYRHWKNTDIWKCCSGKNGCKYSIFCKDDDDDQVKPLLIMLPKLLDI